MHIGKNPLIAESSNLVLQVDELLDAELTKVEQAVQAGAVERRLLTGAESRWISPASVAIEVMSTSAWLSSE